MEKSKAQLRSQTTLRLVTSGVLIGMATVMSMIKVFEMPYGGSITLFSMVPIVVLGYMYGVKWGLLCGTVFGLLQALLGATMSQAFAGLEGLNVLWMALLDYLVAFTVLGLSGLFSKLSHYRLGIALGAALGCVLRYLCHFLSGYILWGSYAEWYFSDVMANDFGASVLANFSGDMLALIYSAVYNASYMLPETIITIVGVVALISVKPLRKYIKGDAL